MGVIAPEGYGVAGFQKRKNVANAAFFLFLRYRNYILPGREDEQAHFQNNRCSVVYFYLLLLQSDGTCAIIEAIQIEQLVTPETTYNFEVADFHTYYVSERNILTHNMCARANRPDGMTTEEHVRLHEVADNTKDLHGIFNGDSVQITNEAWKMRGSFTVDPRTGNLVYKIPFANAGVTGGSAVAVSEACNGVAIVIQRGTSNLLVTTYPIVM